MARLAWIRTSVSCRVHRGSRDRGVDAAAAAAAAAAAGSTGGEFSLADIVRRAMTMRPLAKTSAPAGIYQPLNRRQSLRFSAVSIILQELNVVQQMQSGLVVLHIHQIRQLASSF